MHSLFDPSPLRGARKILFFLALAGSLGGLQGVFSVQMAMGSPYLISLGFSKPLMPFVWFAGPLAGLFGQPYFGLCSDQCRSPWGRRKPFIAGGAMVIICSLLALAWAEDIVRVGLWILGPSHDHDILQTTTMIVAAVFVWTLNFAIQPLQCGLRALIVESCPPEQIDEANAWASRVVSIGGLLGYGAGFMDLSRLFGTQGGHTQFKALSVLASCGLAITVGICCFAIRERDPNEYGPPSMKLKSVVGKIEHIWGSIFKMPPQVVTVCEVQLCSWIGWFSFLYYITTYIGEIYLQNIHPADLVEAQKSANRHGSLALLLFASTQLLTSIMAPFFITKPQRDPTDPFIATTALSRFLSRQLRSPWSSLRALWILSHTIFAVCMFSTLLVSSSVAGTTIIVAFVGTSNALSQIVPFTLISLILSRYQTSQGSRDPTTEKNTIYETEPGIVMGIHNMSIAAPQLIAAVGSSLIFWLLGTDCEYKSRSTGWVLRAGGVAALVAVWMTLKVRDETENEDEKSDAFMLQCQSDGESYTLLTDMVLELHSGMDL